MKIRYFGHCAFQLTLDNGIQILMDPFGDPDNGQWFECFPQPVEPDIVVITHPHFDHDNLALISNKPTIVRDALTVSTDGFRILGYSGRHARHYGQEFGQKNVVFVIEAEGLRICHWGDNRTDFNVAQLGRIDMLMVPADDQEHILDLAETNAVIARIAPRIVLPTHYHVPGITVTAAHLGGIDGWLRGQKHVRHIDGNEITINDKLLPDETQIWVYGDPA